MYIFVEYPKCSTCQRARKWLEGQGVEFTSRHILEENPTREELAAWAEKLPLKRLWNTSGQKYRQLGLPAPAGDVPGGAAGAFGHRWDAGKAPRAFGGGFRPHRL